MRHDTMNWLLVLSALFSTLTGVGAGARPLEAVVQQSALSVGIRHRVAVSVPVARGHFHLLGAFGTRSGFAVASRVPVMLLATPLLYLDRPRA